MDTQTKVCQNCKSQFQIEPEDFAFYERIKVPPPTFCPDCRFQRRYAHRNQMNLHKIKCDLCGKETVSMYPADKPFPVYCQKCWWGDGWDPFSYGRDYDFGKPFFAQFRELQMHVPRVSLVNENPVNSEYCNYSYGSKNCYLCFSIMGSEDCYYIGPQIIKNRSCVSCSMSFKNELCAEAVDCDNSHGLTWSRNSQECLDSAYLVNCRNCQNCIGCANLRNKQYHILNKPYSKEDYAKKLKELDLGSYSGHLRFQRQFSEFLTTQPYRFAVIDRSTDVTGDNIENSKNCKDSFVLVGAENCRYCFILNGNKDCYDVDNSFPNTELSCEGMSVAESTRVYFCSAMMGNSSDNWYCDNCTASRNNFGNISLKKGEYCILNKRYEKGEYEKLVARIKEHMSEMPYSDRQGIKYGYGEFFPIELSPFAYNESLASEYFPLTPDEIKAKGYLYRGNDAKEHKITVPNGEIPDNIKDAKDDITGQVLECAHQGKCNEMCTGAFRVLPDELGIYRQLNMPLPRLCVNCRYRDRMSRKNPLKLWPRNCACAGLASENGAYQNKDRHFHAEGHCPNKFQTSYAPNRPEIVYCEQCYNAEIA